MLEASARQGNRTRRPPTRNGLVQEFLNRSDRHLWAIVSNGLRLRILRDNRFSKSLPQSGSDLQREMVLPRRLL
jgi:hypothetical protein